MAIVAKLRLAPCGDLSGALLGVLYNVAAHNLRWIKAAQQRGLVPPCCSSCADPPWCERPVRYVEHHGAPKGAEREYRDGPTMFATGYGTCADIVAYDYACAVAAGKSARIDLEEQGNGNYHAVLYVDDVRTDPAGKIAAEQSHNVGRACGCGSGQ